MKTTKFNLLLLSILFIGIAVSCGGDPIAPPEPPEPDPPPTAYAALRDVRLTQTINGVGTFTVTEFDDELLFSSRLVFQDRPINWTAPTFTQAFLEVFVITEENITVTTEDGTEITSVTIEIEEDNRVTVAFQQVNNSFNYLRDKVVVINIKATLPDDITEAQAEVLNNSGFRTQSYFFVETIEQNVRSSIMIVNSRLNLDVLFDIVGCPDNHLMAFRLNVIYFVPSDVNPNPRWRRRLSELLLNHQLYTRQWMEYWGYVPRAFGLPMDENGMVDIVMVRGAGRAVDYPYSSAAASRQQQQVRDYFARNGLSFHSDHFLLITATNASFARGVSIPFFGMGRWGFALDFPEMETAMMPFCTFTGVRLPHIPPPAVNTSLIGGLFHEMHHGLNLLHAGETYSQRNSPRHNVALMGTGNHNYGRSGASFLTVLCAATLNVSQTLSFVNRPFYTPSTGVVSIDNITINGGYLHVSGSFTADVPATDVIIHITEAHDPSVSGNNSPVFRADITGNTFSKIIPIWEVRQRDRTWRVNASLFTEDGNRVQFRHARTFTMHNRNGYWTMVPDENIMNDVTWEVTTSHPLPTTDNPRPEHLVDGNISTFLSQVRPGGSIGGVSVPATDEVWVTVNFNQPIEFNAVILTNRNAQEMLNPREVTFFGSNDGVTWTTIIERAPLPERGTNIVSFDRVTFRYLRMRYDAWGTAAGAAGQTVQVAQLTLRNT